MNTARATTDEGGNIHSLAVFIGRPIPASQLYSDLVNPSRTWELRNKTTLNELRYSLKRYYSAVALHLIEVVGYLAYEPVYVYQNKTNGRFKGVFAIHCYERGKVTVVDLNSNYNETSDVMFLQDIKRVLP